LTQNQLRIGIKIKQLPFCEMEAKSFFFENCSGNLTDEEHKVV